MKNAISPIRKDNYPEWYLQVIKNAGLAENSPVRGCMVIKPWGYSIWENIQRILDRRFKDTGHENAYFPLLIPLSFLQKEAEHVEGFAKECAVVTHHRLEADGEGRLLPSGKLDEPLIVRPTSETIIGEAYSRWVQSYRDLPILINQWANVMRWEMRPRLFLRTSEFLWQEGHTAHASQDEAETETRKMLDIYEEFVRDYLAIPVVKGEKTPEERFPGAVNTYTVEAMMQDLKALQMGTSHFLGQNFSKSSGIRFKNMAGEDEYAWTTSWGVSTRLIGGMIMSHSDDDGLVLPPMIAPKQVVLLPLIRKSEERAKIMDYCRGIMQLLSEKTFGGEKVRVFIDDRDIGGGDRFWSNVKRGVPVRLEVGSREMDAGTITVGTRDKPAGQRTVEPKDKVIDEIADVLSNIHSSLFNRAKELREHNTHTISTVDELKKYFSASGKSGFAICYSDPYEHSASREAILKELKVSARCIPFGMQDEEGECIFTGKKVRTKVIYARAY